MPQYRRHVFICTNRRDADSPKGSCAARGSEALCEAFKREVKQRGLGRGADQGITRANAAGCLDQCAAGPVVVVYPEQVWYAIRTEEDVKEVVEQHLVHGETVERLRMK